MNWQPIHKHFHAGSVRSNLDDYDRVCAEFKWAAVRAELNGAGNANIAAMIDRHATGALRDRIAIRWLSESGTRREISYAELAAETNRFANVLRGLGVRKGDRVFVCAGRIPDLYIAALGTLKNASVFCPIFSAFGPEPIFQRLSRGDAKVLVTTTAIYKQKIFGLRSRLPLLEHVLLVDADEDLDAHCFSLSRLTSAASNEFVIPPTSPEDMALLHFTSGTTGMPKGAIHVHDAALTHYITGKFVLDFQPNDIFWCTADPGWVTGTSYGIIAPLLHGVTNVVDEAEFDAERWYRILQDEKVTVWYTAPTAIRRLMRMSIAPREKFDLSALRLIHSVGEPLNPEAVVWGEKTLGLPIHDNWWQTETGGIMIANFLSMDIRPGSMGKPLPGIEAAVVRHVNGNVEEVREPNVEGDLALRPGWPSMFRGYLHEEERYRKCFVGGWYITGDLAKRDEDGYFWFVGRADDIIKTAGHMVGPFEVESALMEHPAVAEAAVIGKPDPIIGELVKAFIALKLGIQPNETLRKELLGFGRKRLGSAVAPKEIQFEKDLPKTRSGKVMRRLLKAREMGLPVGDTSTLEVSA
ncbi:MAG: acetate--CoA ligase [Chthoniobacterales bacterium]